MSSTPERIGKYRVIKRLGRGGTAEVYLAEQQGTAGFSKQLVLKVLYKDLAQDQDFVKMLVDEARITARLIHANICQVLDLGLDPEAHYLAMEYVPGTDLLTLLDRCQERGVLIPLEVAAHVVAEVLSALDYAHDATDDDGTPLGIIHRDVSPQNILISHHGEVKLTDFGIAKAAQRQTRTQAGQIKGKMIYMSPEHASGRPMDHRADIFSAGIVLHELLRGQAFAAADSNVVLQMRKAGMEVESISEHRPEVPKELEAALKRALQADPDQRFPSAEAFRAALVEFLFCRPLPFGRSELACFMQSVTPGPARRLADAGVAGPRPTVLDKRGTGGATTDATVRTPMPREPAAGGLEAVATCPDDMGAIMAIARQEAERSDGLFPAADEGGAFEADEEATSVDDPPPLDELDEEGTRADDPVESETRPDLQDARTEILDKD
jgi:eukaryotic-like serine/threonine-protein kinase